MMHPVSSSSLPPMAVSFREAEGDFVCSIAIGEGAERQHVEVMRVAMAAIDEEALERAYIEVASRIARRFIETTFQVTATLGDPIVIANTSETN